jgi:hypothetical protein
VDLENPEMDQIECFQQHWMDKKITLKINIMQVSRSKMFTHLQIQPPLQKQAGAPKDRPPERACRWATCPVS